MMACSLAALPAGGRPEVASLPVPVTNNAVVGTGGSLFSFLGLEGGTTFANITQHAWRYDGRLHEWLPLPSVPGPHGRIAATAQAVGGKIYLFGGYTVSAEGNEVSTPNLDVFDPATDSWSAAAPMPVPVDDAASGVWRGRLIYLISGWSQKGNVPNVQVYDPAADRWSQATPIPGAPVFGQAGGVVGDSLVYCDGVSSEANRRPKFQLSDACYRGDIDPSEPTRVSWSRLPAHPGQARYRMAAGTLGDNLVFAGGTHNPYNYNGVGYDGHPSEPSREVFAYHSGGWQERPRLAVASMDHRGLAERGGALYTVGGMLVGQELTGTVTRLR